MILTHPIEQTEWRGMLERKSDRNLKLSRVKNECFIDESEEFLKTEDDFREKEHKYLHIIYVKV